jgi:hypothetical protein
LVSRTPDAGYVKEDIDAPFPVFSIEALDGPIAFFKNEKDGNNIYSLCVMVIEVAPKTYSFFALTEYVDPEKPGGGFFGVWASNSEGATTKHFLSRLNKEKTGMEPTKVKVKLGSGKMKRVHEIRRIIHVTPRSKVESYTGGTREVEWSHRFEVRGHWVSLPGGLGKNREGDYCVKDWTWRVNHERGPKELPLIKKTRVVGEIE